MEVFSAALPSLLKIGISKSNYDQSTHALQIFSHFIAILRKLDEKNITFSKPVSRPSFVIALSNESAIFEDGEMVIGAGLLAVTVCDRAKQVCPVCSTETQKLCKSPRARAVILRSFMDPASAVGSEEEQLDSFRRARDEIMEWISQTFGR